jgi:hypothetical protein
MKAINCREHGVLPRWANYKQASAYSGLSTRVLQDYVRDGLIRSSLVRKPGAKRGVRIVDLTSLDALIEQGIGAKSEIVMNLKTRAKRDEH